MEDLEKALNLANLCSSNAINNYSGAGANAVSSADRVFATTPLSEVVWSPHKGLSLKCADPSLIEKKSPILWSTEIFNIIVSPPPTAGGGKSDSSVFMTGGDSTKIYLQTYSEDKIHHGKTSLGYPQNGISVVQSCPIRSHEHSPGTFQEMKIMKGTSEIYITRGSPSEDKDKGASPRKNQPISNNAWATGAVSSEGPEDGRTADCLSHKPEEVVPNLAKVEAEHKSSNKESLQEHIEKDLDANNDRYLAEDEALVYDAPVFNKWNCPEDLACTTEFKDGKQAQSKDIANENCHSGLTSHFTYLHPLAEKCAQISNLKDALCSSSFNFLTEAKSDNYNQVTIKSDNYNQVTIVASEPSNKRVEWIYPVCKKGKSPLIFKGKKIMGVLHTGSINARVRKGSQSGKKRVSSTERTRSVSEEKDDSYGSVKSCNGAEPFVMGKRGRSFGEEIFKESKRMKKSSDGNSFSGPHVREDSSFINWISNMTKGLFRSDHVEAYSLPPVPNPVSNKQRVLCSTPTSNDSNIVAASRIAGFGSTWKALCWSSLDGKSNEIVNFDHSGDSASSKELQLENLTIGKHTNRVNHDNEGIKLQKPVPISSMRIGQGVCHFGEPPPVVPNISVSNSHIREKVKDNIWEQCDLPTVGSSSSSLHNGSSSPSEGKEASKLGSFILNKPSNLSIMNKAGGIPASVWITRFSPKVDAPMECTTQCNQGTFLESEKHVDECNMFLHHSQNDIDSVGDNMFLHHSQNDIDSVEDCKNSEDCHHSPLEDQKPTSENLHQYSISPMGLCCSKRVHTDLRAKSNLNPILPSQKLKRLEPMTSVFAKRLDAFRHIQTLEVADDLTPEIATCFFCGKRGHFITSCSDVTEPELKDLLKNINSLGRAEKSTCLCIRCFQHNHWAVVCPYASLSSHQRADGNASIINCESFVRKIKGRSDAFLLSNHGVRMCEKGEDQQHQILSGHRIHGGGMSRNVTEFMLQTSVNVDKKSAMKGKQIASTSGEAELGDKSYALFHNLVIKKKPDEQHRIFERIRKLRLSRTDVIRWMESSISHFSLEGFFLRVRLGKWEEGQGGTCYHVACVSGFPRASGEKIYGGCKNRLPVNIGGSKCLIDCCFISNHDFVEDELKAWWSASLRRGGKLPSEVDLDKKLREREMLDL